jgi:SAM-dependent methyltransferase
MCRGALGPEVFPYRTRFNGQLFSYRRCLSCASVIVATEPSADTFARMYAKENYHDNHYAEALTAPYAQSASLLKRHLPAGAAVLDYGCGAGAFLASLKAVGLTPYGIEFDEDAAQHAATVSGCAVFPMAQFQKGELGMQFDAVHLGDVLEHMPDPLSAFARILELIKPGGVLFLEGPLETNPSLVYFAARLFGGIKHLVRGSEESDGAPTHLIRTHAQAQRNFVRHLPGAFQERHWRVYETGWPYAYGGTVKRSIALAARGSSVLGNAIGLSLGNRFEAIYRFQPARADGAT